MKLTWALVAMMALSVSISAFAEPGQGKKGELAIPGCAELNHLWKTRYHRALKILWSKRDIACSGDVAPAISYERAFAEAAYILENTHFNLEGLASGYVPPPTNMLEFVRSKYFALSVDEKSTNPYTSLNTRIVYFYPAVAKETGYQVIGNLIHESRHADGGFQHVVCNDGPNAGRNICDNGLGDQIVGSSSHRAAALYFAWAANARSNWPKPMRDANRALAEWVVRTRINATESQRTAWIAKYLHDW